MTIEVTPSRACSRIIWRTLRVVFTSSPYVGLL